uniref:hypothetical protein n=1 Tax=Halomonas sp. TaxID=1486246 RepID=UPI00261C99D1|nr:hypothetical protein [Halomonas sp.]
MELHKFNHAYELLSVARKIGITVELLDQEEARHYIIEVMEKFSPWKKEGHLSLGDDSNTLSTEEYEDKFSFLLGNDAAYIFFEQNHINKNTVIKVKNASRLSELMTNSYGMEYFISDSNARYLISVNWYSIQWKGDIDLSPIAKPRKD